MMEIRKTIILRETVPSELERISIDEGQILTLLECEGWNSGRR
jgi:hypothetical protein